MARPQSRDAIRERTPPSRPQLRANEALGRGGEVLRRRRQESTDPFHIPEEILHQFRSEGFDLEWKRCSVHNKEDRIYMSQLMENGWRPVNAKQAAGRWHDPGYDGPIEVGGQMLMERPLSLTQHAREEERRKAIDEENNQKRSWRVEPRNRNYFDPDTPQAKRETGIKSAWEPSPDEARPKLEVALGDE